MQLLLAPRASSVHSRELSCYYDSVSVSRIRQSHFRKRGQNTRSKLASVVSFRQAKIFRKCEDDQGLAVVLPLCRTSQEVVHIVAADLWFLDNYYFPAIVVLTRQNVSCQPLVVLKIDWIRVERAQLRLSAVEVSHYRLEHLSVVNSPTNSHGA